jgi:hypothetical protein
MNPNLLNGRVLSIAGSDYLAAGAGIQADIKAITALGGYAMTAVTAITVQDTRGVSAIHPVPDDIVPAQVSAVLADLGADCIDRHAGHLIGDRRRRWCARAPVPAAFRSSSIL